MTTSKIKGIRKAIKLLTVFILLSFLENIEMLEKIISSKRPSITRIARDSILFSFCFKIFKSFMIHF